MRVLAFFFSFSADLTSAAGAFAGLAAAYLVEPQFIFRYVYGEKRYKN